MLNFTANPITLQLPDGQRVTYEPVGTVARFERQDLDAGPHQDNQMPMITRLPVVHGLRPDHFENGDHVLVDESVLENLPQALCGKPIYAPDMGETAVRDEDGNVVAVTQLVVPY